MSGLIGQAIFHAMSAEVGRAATLEPEAHCSAKDLVSLRSKDTEVN